MVVKAHQIVKSTAVLALLLTSYLILTVVVREFSLLELGLAIFLIGPSSLVLFLAKARNYDSRLRMICRVVSGLTVAICAVVSYAAVQHGTSNMAGVVALYLAGAQYLILFFAEAVIGLMTYEG